MKATSRSLAAIFALLALVLAGCGSSDADAATGDGATIESKYGDTTVPEDPERIVVIGSSWVDTALALGIEPVASGGVQMENSPWLEGVIDESTIDDELVTSDGGVNREKVASYDPDLIVVQTFSLADQTAFDELSKIAPVVTGKNANDGWEYELDVVAQATGTEDKADEVKASIDEKAAALAEAAPNLEGKTYQWVRFDEDQLYFGNGSILELLGLQPGDLQDNTQNTNASVSRENLTELDADVVGVFCFTDCTAFKNDPRVADLPSSQYGSLFYADWPLAVAINGASPLSLEYIFDELGPQLTEAASKMGG